MKLALTNTSKTERFLCQNLFLQNFKANKYYIRYINKFILKNFISLIPFFFMIILLLGCSNKPVEKETQMLMLFDTEEQAKKEAYKFGCEGAHQMGKKWMSCSMHKHNH